MTIKNMKEFGKAIDAVEDLQSCADKWEDCQFDYCSLEDLREKVAGSRIRIKPKTVTLYEYEHCMDENRVWSETAPLHHNFTGRYIVNAVVTEEVQV